MDIKILVGKRVKELRNKLGISQEELADIAGLDRTYITSVECGKRNISSSSHPYPSRYQLILFRILLKFILFNYHSNSR